MNAKEFLALVEKHPEPWSFYDAGEGVHAGYPVYSTKDLSVLEFEDAQSLADAAPAMAAAIIRYFEAVNAENLTASDAMTRHICLSDAFDALLALRASMPESLRP